MDAWRVLGGNQMKDEAKDIYYCPFLKDECAEWACRLFDKEYEECAFLAIAHELRSVREQARRATQ